MTDQFHYNLQALMDEYEEKTGHKLTKYLLHERTGISRPAINRMLDPKTKRADLDVLYTLVTHLRIMLKRKITLDDLLPYNE